MKHKATKDCKCPGCGKMYFSEKSVKRHQKRFCKNIPMEDVLLFKCDNCSKAFKTKGNFTKHQKTCVKKPCKNTNKDSYKCGTCDEHFSNKRELYLHRQLQHGGGITGDTSGLNRTSSTSASNKQENFSLENPPWENEEGEITDRLLKDVYEANLGHILRRNEIGKVLRHYNFPTENLKGGVQEIMNHKRKSSSQNSWLQKRKTKSV